MTTLLIDGDPLAYQAAASNESRIEWDEGDTTVTVDREAVTSSIDYLIAGIKHDLGVKNAIITLSCSTTNGWRRQLLSTYKSNREGARKPVELLMAKEHMANKYKAYMRPTLEADDILGILATHKSLVKGDKIVVSIDKDLLQVPGRVYNPRHKEMTNVSVDQADHLHYLQTLAGDPVDGYTGIPRVGPVKARELLVQAAMEDVRPWNAVVAAYASKGLTEADALIQARVARICRAEDYDFKARKVKLWSPPT